MEHAYGKENENKLYLLTVKEILNFQEANVIKME